VIGKKQIWTHQLAEVLNHYLPDKQSVYFLSINMEGLYLQVLRANNWGKYRPKILFVEDLQPLSLSKIADSPVVGYLDKKGYELYAKAVNTLIFCQKS